MAIIKSSILTNKGKDAVTKLIANDIQLTFKRIELSEQDTSSMQVVQIEALEALTGVKQHGTINTVSKNNPSEVTVYTLADNQNGALPDYNSPVTASYTLRTVGLFANDGTEDFLYEVLTFSVPDTVPTSEISYNQQFNFTTVVGNSENIKIIVSPAGVITTDMLKGISVTGKNGLIGGGTIEQSREIEPDYGVEKKKILEGHRLKQVLGVDEFGELNNSDVKIVGNAYWDNQTAEMYICTVSTDKNYADADFFEPFSNSALLGKLKNLDDGINSFRQFDTVFYKGISIDIVYNDSLMWFSFEGNPSEEIFNPGVIYTLPNNIKPKSPSEPMSKYLSNDKSISFRINKNGQISMHITSVQNGSNVSFSPADNRAIRAYCCIPYSF